MSTQRELTTLVSAVNDQAIDSVRKLWEYSVSAQDPISRFDSLAKGWDRLASEIWPDDSIGYRFKKLTALCTSVAWSVSIENLLSDVGEPIRNDLERLASDAQSDFDRAQKKLRSHRNHKTDDKALMEAVGTLLWTIRSNSMHGRKTPSGPLAPTNRDEQICELGAVVIQHLFRATFPSW